MIRVTFLLTYLLFLISSFSYAVPSAKHVPSVFDPSVMIIDEKNYIGKVVDNFDFVLEDGTHSSLKDFTQSGKPTVILPIFYKCMTGCPVILNNAIHRIKKIDRDFNFIVLSFDKNDTISDLVEFKNSHSGHFEDRRIKFGILTDNGVINFTNSTGFKFFFSKQDNTFVHTLTLIFVSDKGRITRYLFGSNPKEGDVRIALAEASIDKFSFNSIIDFAYLVCFTYNSKTRSYELNPILFFGGIGIVMVLSSLITSFIVIRRKKCGS
ncbi:MAG: SCO family protein [Brevinematia bacterium]